MKWGAIELKADLNGKEYRSGVAVERVVIFIYFCSAQLILKSIGLTVCEHEYININMYPFLNIEFATPQTPNSLYRGKRKLEQVIFKWKGMVKGPEGMRAS